MQHLPDEVMFEKGGLLPDVAGRLSAMGYAGAAEERPHIADAPAIGRLGSTWLGVAEPRRDAGGLAEGP